MLRAYVLINFDIRAVNDELGKNVTKTSNFEYLWVSYLSSIFDDLQTSFNTVRPKRFLKSLPDAYSPKAHTLFYAMGCIVHGDFRGEGDGVTLSSEGKRSKPCHYFPIGTSPNDKNIYGEVYAVKMKRFNTMIENILKTYPEIHTVTLMYQCDFERELHSVGSKIHQFFNSNLDNNLTPKSKAPPPLSPPSGRGSL